jgi:hypothetical protein
LNPLLTSPKLLKKPNPELHVPVKESSRKKKQVTIIAFSEFAKNIRKLNACKAKGEKEGASKKATHKYEGARTWPKESW